MSYDQPGEDGQPVHAEALVGDVASGGLFALTVKGRPGTFDTEDLSAVARSVAAGTTGTDG